VNHRRPWWLVFSLLPPLLALCALFVPSGCGSGGGGGPAPVAAATPATVAVALVGFPPPGNFRSVLLNISGVRINKTPNAGTSSPGWITIAVPSSAGTGNAQNPGDLQIDLMNTQTGAVIFNSAGAPPGQYQTVQVLVDQTNPGTVIPACQSGSANTEGCANYPLTLATTQNPNGNLLPILLNLATPLSVTIDENTPLVIGLTVAIFNQPVNVGDPYAVTITPSETNAGSFLAAVSGMVTIKGVASMFRLSPLSVSAELTGTNTPIETIPVRKRGVYTLELPAAPGGTSYDIFVNGAGVQYAAVQGLTVVPGQSVPNLDFTAVATNPGGFNGIIADACTGLGIPGAQLELLAPGTMVATPEPTPPASFCLDHPEQCVVVATASADQAGNYPMPGTFRNPTGFEQIPLDQPDLALRVSAGGYTTLLSSGFLKPLSKDQLCSASTSPTVCSFSLTTGYINGTVNLVSDPPPGSSVMVQVFAENSGTNQLVSALQQPLVFLHQQTSLPFQLHVPINNPLNPFDLFAVAIDPFQGGPDPFPGHDIPVIAAVPAPASGCASFPPMASPSPTPIAFAPMNCVGHGSISGVVQNPDPGTSVEVAKFDPADPSKTLVQITGTQPGLFSSNSPGNNAYTLCVPPDNYTLQRFEVPSPLPAVPTGTPTAVGSPQDIAVPQPAATSSPCPSTCSNSNSGSEPCPGLCQATSASPL